jgi:cell division protein FtsB
MPFTSLNRKLARQDQYLKRNSGKKRNFKKMIIRVLIVLAILFVVIYLPVRGAYGSTKTILAESRAMNDALKRENLDDIKTHVSEIKKATSGLNTSLNFLFWVRIIPYFGSFYADAKHFAKASEYELTAAETIVESLLPYKAELGFNGTPTPGTDRVAQAVKVLEKTLPLLDKVEPELKKPEKRSPVSM